MEGQVLSGLDTMSASESVSVDLTPLDGILSSFPNAASMDLIPILQKIQKTFGYLPRQALMALSKQTGIPASQIYGVTTFYEQFHLTPHGRHTVRCCRGTACHVREGAGITQAIQLHLGIEPGETTDDMQFTFETVACLGTCFLAPVIMVDNDYHGNLTPGKVKEILERYI